MKRFLFLLPLLVLLCGCPKSTVVTPPTTPPVSADHNITLTWSQTFADSPACSTTVTTSCISGFTEGFISGTATQNTLHTDTSAICTGSSQPEACTSTFNGIIPMGAISFFVNTTYVDANGAACSGAATGTAAGAADCVPATVTTATPSTIGADSGTGLVEKTNS